jgi:hypothetical protein
MQPSSGRPCEWPKHVVVIVYKNYFTSVRFVGINVVYIKLMDELWIV